MPKDDISKAPEDDDNATVDISIKGNEFRTAAARDEILKLVGTVANTKVNQAVRSIPAELYPFLAGPDNSRTKDLESQFNDLRVHIPTQHTWTAQPVSQPAGDSGPLSFLQPSGNNPITLTGNREQVLKARKTLEDNAEALRRQLRSEQVQMNRSRFPFIIGEYGVPLAQFVANTGCTITFTDDENDETVTVIGPADRIEGATQLAEELAFDRFNSFTVDISKHHRSGPGAALNHARNVTRYLQQRNEIERITKSFGTPIDAHATAESFVPWELFVKKDQNTRSAALNDIKSVVLGLPPSKMANLDIDPFFRQHLASNIASHLQENFGVYTVIPAVVDEPILLVFEGDDGKTSNYQVPRVQGVPPATEIQTSQQRLKEAIEHILDIVRQQDEIKEASVEVPLKFHQKLKKFIGEQKKTQSPAEVPARFTVLNTTVTMKGPASTIERFESEINDFVKEQIADEKERGFTLSFLFEEKLGSHLVGKGGSFITQLGNDFDVDVRLADGKVTITGPPAKAEAAKAHIQKLEKQWADEVRA